MPADKDSVLICKGPVVVDRAWHKVVSSGESAGMSLHDGGRHRPGPHIQFFKDIFDALNEFGFPFLDQAVHPCAGRAVYAARHRKCFPVLLNANRAVISAPPSSYASTTSVPKASPLTIRFRRGKCTRPAPFPVHIRTATRLRPSALRQAECAAPDRSDQCLTQAQQLCSLLYPGLPGAPPHLHRTLDH